MGSMICCSSVLETDMYSHCINQQQDSAIKLLASQANKIENYLWYIVDYVLFGWFFYGWGGRVKRKIYHKCKLGYTPKQYCTTVQNVICTPVQYEHALFPNAPVPSFPSPVFAFRFLIVPFLSANTLLVHALFVCVLSPDAPSQQFLFA